MTLSRNRRVVCVATPEKGAYADTFIRNQIERLPADVRVIYGAYLPFVDDDGRPLLASGLLRLAGRLIFLNVLRAGDASLETVGLRRFFIRNHVEAVLAEFGPTGTAVMDACEQVQVPLIVHFHGKDAYDRGTLEGPGRRYPELFNKAAAIVVVSKDMERHLFDLGAPKEKLHYNPCGVDLSLFHGAEPETSPPHFLAVSRFVDKKGPLFTLLAFQIVVERVPEARLIMIGDGPLLESSEQLARTLGTEQSVEFHSSMEKNEEVAATMRRVRAFVQHSIRTSYGDMEGTPVSILEASASGLPVVATRHGGISDAVVEGETGLLVAERDVQGMATQMIRLANEPALAGRLGRAARSYVAAHFSMETSIDNLWHIITEAIRTSGGGDPGTEFHNSRLRPASPRRSFQNGLPPRRPRLPSKER